MEQRTAAVSVRNVTKRFGPVLANDKVCLDIYRGEILALLGENGSGKTTLMNMLSGIYYPDEGEIYINGKPVSISSPKESFHLGIGMIHQHFKLVDVFTAAENIILGLDEKLDMKSAIRKIRKICDQYGFDIDPNQKIYDMSVSQKQTIEIIKVLYRGADILILDEPTAVLTPQETDKLFAILRNMRNAGKAIERTEPVNPRPRIEVKDLIVRNEEGTTKLDHVSFTANSSEILGIAGIAGSGQKELLEAIAGLQPVDSGSISYIEDDGAHVELIGKDPLTIQNMGVSLSFVPEDRLGMGLVGNMDLSDNMMLRTFRKGHSFFTDRKSPRRIAENVVKELEVATPSLSTPIRRLSGGNVQKVLVGREITSAPKVLLTAYAVRGLDIHSSYTIYNLINNQKKQNVAVVYVGEDLDVLVELCDRILVLCGGKVSGIVPGRGADKREIGMMMTRVGGNEHE